MNQARPRVAVRRPKSQNSCFEHVKLEWLWERIVPMSVKTRDGSTRDAGLKMLYVALATVCPALVAGLIVFNRVETPVQPLVESAASAWSFGLPIVGEVLVGVMSGGLLVFTGVMLHAMATLFGRLVRTGSVQPRPRASTGKPELA